MKQLPHIPHGDICQTCGACCAHFRVSFYWAEAKQRGLHEQWTEKRDHHHLCMRGTNAPHPRCAALRGQVGCHVHCMVYEQRPSPCKEVMPGSEQCNASRLAYGLPAIEPIQLA